MKRKKAKKKKVNWMWIVTVVNLVLGLYNLYGLVMLAKVVQTVAASVNYWAGILQEVSDFVYRTF